MKIDVIVAGGWILRRMAEEVANRVDGAVISTLDGDGEAVYFIAYALYHPVNKPRAVYFTHYSAHRVWEEAVRDSDLQICICRKTADLVEEQGGTNVHIIRPGADATFLRHDVVFGVCGAVKSGRKGEHLVQAMVGAGYNIRAWGTGWPCRIVSDDFADLPSFYRSIDYLVVTSTLEGGPVPVVEAIAMGVPVIAPDVGWCWEFPTIHYETGSWSSLNGVLKALTRPPTWDEWGKAHREVLGRLG